MYPDLVAQLVSAAGQGTASLTGLLRRWVFTPTSGFFDGNYACQWALKISGFWASKVSGFKRCPAEEAERPEWGGGLGARLQSSAVERFTVWADNSGFPAGGGTCGP